MIADAIWLCFYAAMVGTGALLFGVLMADTLWRVMRGWHRG